MTNATQHAAGHHCPSCKVDLVMSERQGIEIDYCPQCRGVWLDRGELDKIIERSAREAAPVQQVPQAQPQPYQAQDRDHYRKDSHDGYGKKRKRESFLEMLFD